MECHRHIYLNLFFGLCHYNSFNYAIWNAFELMQVRYIGVSNETSYGVMEFVHAAKVEGLPKIVSIQNSYSLLVRCRFESEFFSHSM